MARTSLIIPFFAVIYIITPPALFGEDVQDAVDQALRFIRSSQNEEGSYGNAGEESIVTPLSVLAFGTSPRRYTDLDGPFVRRAVEWIVAEKAKNSFEAASLSVAAVASVNKFKWAEFLEKEATQMMKSLEHDDFQPQRSFFMLLASQIIFPQGIEESKAPSKEVSGLMQWPEAVYPSLWSVAAGRELPEALKAGELVQWIEQSLTRDRVDVTTVWAGTYLLSMLQDQGRAPEDWGKRLSAPLIDRVGKSMQSNQLKEVAIVTNALSLCHRPVTVQTGAPEADADDLPPFRSKPLSLDEALSSGLALLESHQEKGKFGFSGYADPGITALALSAVVRSSRGLDRDLPAYVNQGFEYLKSLQKEDGSIYQHGLANYVTSASIMAFMDLGDDAHQDTVEAARNYLVILQSDEGEDYSMEQDLNYGGMGYGGDERPDLSNTQMSIEALRAAGLDAEHEAFGKAILFLERCQNLSEVNPTRVVVDPTKQVVSGNDGGGIYSPGASKANLEEIETGIYVARSYGSMTYALLKSYILAGLDGKDRRVQAAVKWIEDHYTLDENPGFKEVEGKDLGQQGLYYYYLTMARALHALNKETLETPDGKTHSWRAEMRAKILALQREDGSWVNHRAPRWFEGNPVLATSYALLVLDLTREK